MQIRVTTTTRERKKEETFLFASTCRTGALGERRIHAHRPTATRSPPPRPARRRPARLQSSQTPVVDLSPRRQAPRTRAEDILASLWCSCYLPAYPAPRSAAVPARPKIPRKPAVIPVPAPPPAAGSPNSPTTTQASALPPESLDPNSPAIHHTPHPPPREAVTAAPFPFPNPARSPPPPLPIFPVSSSPKKTRALKYHIQAGAGTGRTAPPPSARRLSPRP
jgi:hypothetical protein